MTAFPDGDAHAQKGQAGQHQRNAAADRREHAVKAAFGGGRRFGAQYGRPRPFAADGKPLQQPQDDQDQWGCHTNGCRAGNHAHRHG
jgi:hypothetical protein